MRHAIPLLAVLYLLAACNAGPFADVQNPKTYDSGKLSFTYPGNWVVEASGDLEPQAGITVNAISVRGPKSTTILIQDFGQAVPMNAEQACETLMGAVKEEAGAMSAKIKIGAKGPSERSLLGGARAGTRQGYTATIDGEAREAAAEAWVVSLDGRTVVVAVSAETADRVAGKAGFDLVLDTLAIQ